MTRVLVGLCGHLAAVYTANHAAELSSGAQLLGIVGSFVVGIALASGGKR